MNLRDLIEAGILKKGSRDALADYLGLNPNSITDAKAHRRGIPNDACIKLSELLGIDLKAIIAASELATERKEEKKAFWLKFLELTPDFRKVAGYVLFGVIVTNFMTPTPAEAAPERVSRPGTVCIM